MKIRIRLHQDGDKISHLEINNSWYELPEGTREIGLDLTQKDTDIFAGLTFPHPPILKEDFVNLYEDYVRRAGDPLRKEDLN